jgi:hypothetical protein
MMNSSDVNRASRIIDLMRTDDSVDAPKDSIKFAKALFRTRVATPQPSLMERIVAAIRLDLSPGKTALAERSAGTSKARQMLFEAGDNGVDIRISGKSNRFDVRGQILGAGFESGTVTLSGPDIKEERTVDEFGDFQFERLPAGSYEIIIRGSVEIVLPLIEIS